MTIIFLTYINVKKKFLLFVLQALYNIVKDYL